MLLNYSGSSSESSGSLARRRTEAQRESAYSSCDADLLSQSDGSDEEIYVFEDASSVEGHCSSVEDPVFQPYKSARPSLLSTHSQSSLDDDPVFQPYESASAWPSSPRVVQKSSHASLYDDADEGKPSTRSQRQSFTEEEEERKSLQELQEKLAKHKRRRSRRRKPSTSSHQNCDYDQDRSNERFRLDNSVQEDFSDDAEERITSTRSQPRDVMEEESKFPQEEGQEKQAKHSQPDWNVTPSIRVHKSSHARLSHHSKRAKSSTRRHRRVVTEEETSRSSQEEQEEPAKQLYPDVSASSSIRLHKSSHARSSHHAKERSSSTRRHRREVMEEETTKSSQEGQEEPAKQLYSDVSASSSIRRHKSSHARSSHHAKERKSSIRSQQRGVMEEDTSKSSQEGQEEQAKQLYPDVSASTSSHTSLEDDSSFDDPLFQPYESVSSSIHINKSSHVHSSHHANKEGSSHHAKKEKASTRSHRRDVTEEETSKSSQKGQEKQAKHWYPDWKATPSIRRHKSSHARSSHHAKEGKPSTRSQRREVMDEERKFLQEAQEKQTKQWHPDWSVSSSIRVAIEEERSKLLQEKQEKQAKQFSPDIGATPSIRLHKSSHARSSHHAKERKPSMRSQRRYDLEEETSKSSQEGQEKQAKHSQPDVSAMPSIRLSKSSHARTSHHAKKRKPSTRIQQRYALEKESMYLRDAQENEAKYLYPDDCDAPSIRDVMEEERIKFIFLQEGQEGQTKGLHPDWSATPSIRIHKSSHARLSHHSKRAKSSTRSQRRDATKEETSKSSQQGQEKQATHSQPDWNATPSIRVHKSSHARLSHHSKRAKSSTRRQRRVVTEEETSKSSQEGQEEQAKQLYHLYLPILSSTSRSR